MNRNKKIFIFLSIGMLFIFCAKEKEVNTTTSKILTGWLTENKLLEEFPAYQTEKDAYQPDNDVMTRLDSLNKYLEVLVFLGTYCPDSKREVPRFFKIAEQLNISYKLFGLDRADVDTSGMRAKYDIKLIPTFIVYEKGEEIGRIIESPMVSIESDLLEICSNF